MFRWDPPREAFTLPIVKLSVAWYGILFVIGFILAYFAIQPVLRRFLAKTSSVNDNPKQMAFYLSDRLAWFVIFGAVIGARLGEVFFYEWSYFKDHPWEIFKVWHGGLASHGGVVGVILALFLFTRYMQRSLPQLTFLALLDRVAVPTGLLLGSIRLGNFVNQELLGTPTTLPWGVVFGHPADHSFPIPRHPVQLYEAIAYFAIFLILWFLWKYRKWEENPGALLGTLFILGFGSRFILEYWKAPFDSIYSSSSLHMGQLLSIPFLIIGIVLVWYSKKKKNFHGNRYLY